MYIPVKDDILALAAIYIIACATGETYSHRYLKNGGLPTLPTWIIRYSYGWDGRQ